MNIEHSDEIYFFRTTLQDYITPLMDSLKGEYSRLETLPTQCQDEYLIKLYGKKHYKDSTPWRSPKFYGRTILDILVTLGNIKNNTDYPANKTPTLSLMEKVQGRENNLNRLLKSLGIFVRVAPDVLVFDASFRYAERKKFYDVANLDSSSIGIMTPQEIVSYLSELSTSDKKLFTAFIKNWSKRYEITLFREALISRDLQAATEYLTGTNGGASAFAIEVSSVAKGLHKICSFTNTVQQGIKSCKKIDPKYYIKIVDALSFDFLNEIEESYYSEATLEELKNGLCAKQHLFTKNECNAVLGEEIHTTIEQTEDQPVPVNNTTIVINETLSTKSAKEEKLTPKNRVNRPPRFSGDKGERAFRLLFEQLDQVYIDETTYENFAGLFRCLPPEQEPTSYSKIKWIAQNGVRSLQCFLEALYRPSDNIRAHLDKQALSQIFFIDSNKNLKLSNNPLYCWGKDKLINFKNSQEKDIMAFIDIIKKALDKA